MIDLDTRKFDEFKIKTVIPFGSHSMYVIILIYLICFLYTRSVPYLFLTETNWNSSNKDATKCGIIIVLILISLPSTRSKMIYFINIFYRKILSTYFFILGRRKPSFGKRTGQNSRKIFLHFQNGSFYIAKWPILLGKMIHFGK